MKIYTRTGDAGQTSLFGGARRSKADLRVEAYGGVDEAQAVLGLVMAEMQAQPLPEDQQDPLLLCLQAIQNDTFVICAELARTETRPSRKDPVLAEERIQWLEDQIDHYDQQLPVLQAFILQGGSRVGAHLHVARAVVRRAERNIVALAQTEPVSADVLKYINRLSDLLFVLARFVNAALHQEEITWKLK